MMNAQSMIRVSARQSTLALRRAARGPQAAWAAPMSHFFSHLTGTTTPIWQSAVVDHSYSPFQRRFMSSETGQKEASENEVPEQEQPSESTQTQESAEQQPENESQVTQLQEKVSQLEDQLKEMTEIRVRLLAEMENVRAIAKRDVDNARTYAISKFAKQVLDVADNLNRALESVPGDELKNEENNLLRTLFEGVEATDVELRKILKSHDIEEFGQVGEPFDPNRHEAMFQTAHSDQEPGTIAQVLKTGYTFKDRILRPAQVGTAE